MCRSTYDVSHKALELSQETRRRHNEFLATQNVTPPPDGPEMAPVPYFNYEMPPLDDAMFYGYFPGQFAPSVPGGPSSQGHDDEEDNDDAADSDEYSEEEYVPTPPPPFF